MRKLSSRDFLVICISKYLKDEPKENRKRFLDFAYTMLHDEFREIELLETEKVETALENIKMLMMPQRSRKG